MAIIKTMQRRGSSAAWAGNNPVLAPGEFGLEVESVNPDGTLVYKTDPVSGGKVSLLKLGDGKTPWNQLPYANGQGGDLAAHKINPEAHAATINEAIKKLSLVAQFSAGQSAGVDLNNLWGTGNAGISAYNAGDPPLNAPSAPGAGVCIRIVDSINHTTRQFWYIRNAPIDASVGRLSTRQLIHSTGVWSAWSDFQSSAWKDISGGFVGIQSNGSINIGPQSNLGNYASAGIIKIAGQFANSTRISITRHSDTPSAGASVALGKSRGTESAPTPAQPGDILALIEFTGLFNGNTPNGTTLAADLQVPLDPTADITSNFPRSYFRFRNGNNSSGMGNSMYIYPDRVSPGQDNFSALGHAALRWSDIYAASGAINSSDERLKSNFREIPEQLLEAWGEHVSPCLFQWRESVERKGDKARIHAGYLAQQVEAAFQAAGLDPADYGVWCYNRFEARYEDVEVIDQEAVYEKRLVPVTDDEGSSWEEERAICVQEEKSHPEKVLIHEAGDIYSLRYDQVYAIEAAYQRWQLKHLENRLAALEARPAELENKR